MSKTATKIKWPKIHLREWDASSRFYSVRIIESAEAVKLMTAALKGYGTGNQSDAKRNVLTLLRTEGLTIEPLGSNKQFRRYTTSDYERDHVREYLVLLARAYAELERMKDPKCRQLCDEIKAALDAVD